MKFKQKNRKSFSQKIAILLLVSILAIPTNYFFTPKVEAGILGGNAVVVVGDTSPTTIKSVVAQTLNQISTAASALSLEALVYKENILDRLAYSAAKVFLHAVVRSTINWINSGFQGAPAFVTDLSGFLLSVADETAGDFIYNDTALDFLCSPFKLDIKIALAVQYNKSRPGNYQPQCTLSQVVDNVEGFLDNDFSAGGWAGWMELALSEESNPTKAFLNSQAEMYARIANAEGEEMAKLNFGNGFLSLEICDVAEKASGAKPNCVIGTPGSVIANSINDALRAGQDELIAADEINEVFNALFSQLANKAFTGAYGLLGLGGNSQYSDNRYGITGNASFLDAVAEEEDKLQAENMTWILEQMDKTIKTETTYLTYQNIVAENLTNLLNSQNFASGTSTASSSNSSCTLSNLPSSLTNKMSTTENGINVAQNAISILNGLKESFTKNSDIRIKQDVISQYQRLNESGLLHTNTDVADVKLYIDLELEDDLTTWRTALRNAGC